MASEEAVKNCPKCGGSMLKGYLGPYFGKMRWNERKGISVWHGIQAWRARARLYDAMSNIPTSHFMSGLTSSQISS